jgi:hypothetical protein
MGGYTLLEESDSCSRLIKFLKENPEYLPVLKAAIIHEKNHKEEIDYEGWEWDDVRAKPQSLVKLVTEGFIDRKYKSKRRSYYKLHDPESVTKAVSRIEGEEAFQVIKGDAQFMSEPLLPIKETLERQREREKLAKGDRQNDSNFELTEDLLKLILKGKFGDKLLEKLTFSDEGKIIVIATIEPLGPQFNSFREFIKNELKGRHNLETNEFEICK